MKEHNKNYLECRSDNQCRPKLKMIFEKVRAKLSNELTGLYLPKDSERIQSIIIECLNHLFDKEGDFRQHLTQSEDYILQAAISLLNAQQSVAKEVTSVKPIVDAPKPMPTSVKEAGEDDVKCGLKRQQYPMTLGATAVGGAAGALVLGSWGAVFGAIVGTAVVLYCTTEQQRSTKKPLASQADKQDRIQPQIIQTQIDTEVFLNIVEKICESVDALIGTFRSQISRVVDKYESQNKPTLESDYQELIENIQALLGAYEMDLNNDNRSKRIDQRIQLLSECLENYDLQAVNYDGTNDDFFNFQPSSNVNTNTMVLPAILKNEKVIIKGKVFTKE